MNAGATTWVFAALLCLLAPPNVHAQEGTTGFGPGTTREFVRASGSRQVGIVRSSRSLGPSHVNVTRRIRGAPRDIILVDDQAASHDLIAALYLFSMLRSEKGDSLQTPVSAVPSDLKLPATLAGGALASWADSQLVRLRTSRGRWNVPGIGVTQMIRVRVPAARIRISSR